MSVAKILLSAGLPYTLCYAYEHYTTAEEKNNWESKIKLHHGEVGILVAILGFLLRSLTLILSGISLALHNIDDVGKWFKDHKFR